ncbi:hypothetical protein SI65_10236 [Aspergillus cristatus]|uniref:Uncharacterized protein n=1 Tax=Aspergillus cristatus TaxID=573508 RepID=A0A1E3B063_ASPCR|nr:hypothetical protein SI65_10236 [Aspergillus cristatus]
MATPMKQALQGLGDGWGYKTHCCGGAPARTTFRRAQSYQGAATIPSQYQCGSTPSTPTASGGKGPKR